MAQCGNMRVNIMENLCTSAVRKGVPPFLLDRASQDDMDRIREMHFLTPMEMVACCLYHNDDEPLLRLWENVLNTNPKKSLVLDLLALTGLANPKQALVDNILGYAHTTWNRITVRCEDKWNDVGDLESSKFFLDDEIVFDLFEQSRGACPA